MTAAAVLDVISRLLDCAGEASDAVSVYTQVKNGGRFRFNEIAKVRVSNCLETSTTFSMSKIMG